jgi:hypothetical protein
MSGFAVTLITSATNGFNDWYIDAGGNLVTTSGVEGFTQSIRSSVWLWLGEYEYNTTLGVPYKAILDNPHTTQPYVEQQIKVAIMLADSYLTDNQRKAYGVKTINQMTFGFNKVKRALTVSITIILNNDKTIVVET